MADTSPNKQRFFDAVDYVVFVLTFVFSLAIGLYFSFKSRHRRTTDEYLLGDRKLGVVPVALSMCVSIVSTGLLLGGPAETYYHGVVHRFWGISMLLGSIISAIFFVPLLHPLKLTSAHKYLELRFGSKAARISGALLFLTSQVVYIGCVMYGPATALETVTNIPVEVSIVLVGIIGTLYTTVGGIKAVIWTDVFQTFVMLAGVIAIVIQGSILCGGMSEVWKVNREGGRFVINDGNHITDRFTVFSVLVGNTVLLVSIFGVNQPCVQRYCATETMTKGQIAVLLAGPVMVTFDLLIWLVGMIAYAYYEQKGCDPLAGGLIKNPNQIAPYLVMEILSVPGLPGLFMSSLVSAALSSLSSSINSMSAVVWDDILADRLHHLSKKKKVPTATLR